tara:strand:+ start:546 stop:695 length:150 start_codon:yes stop_codon:yes gene_type:complete
MIKLIYPFIERDLEKVDLIDKKVIFSDLHDIKISDNKLRIPTDHIYSSL